MMAPDGKKIPTVLKEPKGQQALDLLQLCAHVLIILPEALERVVGACESVADAADLYNLYLQRKGIAEGLFTKEEMEENKKTEEEPVAEVSDGNTTA